MSQVVVYTKPNCIQCKFTTREMTRLGLDFVKVNLEEDAEAEETMRAAGYSTLPVVVSEHATWTGFVPDRIRSLVAESGKWTQDALNR